MNRLSAACRFGVDGPLEEQRHACTGCDCTCHMVGPPENFRQLVEHARERAQAERKDQEET